MKFNDCQFHSSALCPHGRPSLKVLMGLAAAMLILSCVAQAGTSPYKMCLTEVIGLPQSDGHGGFTFPRNPPVIDGVITGDTGWTNTFRYVFQNGTNNPYGAMQAIKKGNVVYFSFETIEDNEFDQYDSVVIGLDNSAGTFTYILVHPVTDGFGATAGVELPDNQVQFWQTNNPAAWGAPSAKPTWLHASASSGGVAPHLVWNLELSIDNSVPGSPQLPNGAGSTFGIYVNIIRSWFSGPQDTQFTWPPSVPVPDSTNPANNPPDPTQWGNGTLDTAQTCSGVYFNHGDITNSISGGPATNVISLNNPNTFTAVMHNSGTSIAKQLTATFKIANFGLPADKEWQKIGLFPPAPGTGHDDSVANNPTVVPVDIPARVVTTDGSNSVTAGPWTLTGTVSPAVGNKGYYGDPANNHQCILVELNSLAGDTLFVNRSTWNNFDLSATASEFKSYPAIVSADYPAVSGRANQVFHLKVIKQPDGTGNVASGAARPGATATSGGSRDKERHFLNYTVQGCRTTGAYLTVDGIPSLGPNRQVIPGPTKKFENCLPVGAYGYQIHHVGPVDSWDSQLSASGAGVTMRQLADGEFELEIPQGAKAQLVTTVKPVGGGSNPPVQGKFAVFADLGVAIPHGTFGAVADPGVSFNAGLEYILKPNVSLEGILGVHHFSGKIAGDTTGIQFTGGAKVYLTNTPNRVFFRAGLGGYHFTSATTNFGGYFGGGLLHEFNAHFGLEGVYTFHTVNTPGAATKFSSIQGGVRYAF